MKTIMYFFMTVSATLFACHQPVNKINIQQPLNLTNQEKETAKSGFCLAQADAEKILGQTAKLTESSSENKNGVTKFRCTYTANTIDPKTSKTGNLYYLLEEFENVDSSQKAYSDILGQNENMPGLKKLNEIGDQAFLHTDDENFLMIISRKDNKILRLKVNKLTSMTSLNELQNISKTITATL
ncbi:MAG: hypothetical protein MUW56_18385 [Chryseobacterium sp.]|uniref:hypothetical protein n=1 Tax=Chryseobacterium sp. TaxID=1871047 RepID=UPI0025B8E2AA|nr:hypothetical protein [Chryseobacterium sp.]MCJ7935531.1 hypothetical protein [Chryseobacterium sp.]